MPRPIRKPTLAAPATTNSAVSTEPITLRGSIRPETSSAGVATGPQPPPPVASTKPATRPSGPRNRPRSGPAARLARSGREKRTSRYAPRVNRMRGHPGRGGLGGDGAEEGGAGERADRTGHARCGRPPASRRCRTASAPPRRRAWCRSRPGAPTRRRRPAPPRRRAAGWTRSTRTPCRARRRPAARRARPERGSAACARAPPFSPSPIDLVDNAARRRSGQVPYPVDGTRPDGPERGAGQLQALGSATSSLTRPGSVPLATSAMVTSSRISRSLARSAIQTSCRARAAPW